MRRFRGDDDGRVDVTKAHLLESDPVWDGMPLADFQRFSSYIREVADALGLREWTIRLRLRPEGEDDGDEAPLATIKVSPESRFATIRLGHSFAHEPRRVQQQTLIHETLHIVFEPMLHTVIGNMTDLVGTAHSSTIEAFVSVEKERAVDGLAVALSPRMPRLPKRCKENH